jgi:hypothetical protein
MYEGWDDNDKSWIRQTMIQYGLSLGVAGLTGKSGNGL